MTEEIIERLEEYLGSEEFEYEAEKTAWRSLTKAVRDKCSFAPA